jgi:hypothetical protein
MLRIKIWEAPHLKTVKPILLCWNGDKESLLAALKLWQPVPGVTIPLRRLLIHKLEKVLKNEASNYKRHGATD